MNAPNTVPIPTPAPAKPTVAAPAPINFAACRIIFFFFSLLITLVLLFTLFLSGEQSRTDFSSVFFFFVFSRTSLYYASIHFHSVQTYVRISGLTTHREVFFGFRVGFPFAIRPHGVTSGRPPRVRPPCG